MKGHTSLLSLVLIGFASFAAAADNPSCLSEYNAEVARITRNAEQAAAVNPPGRDITAQQQLMIPVHEALKAAATRAEQCNKESQGEGSSSGSAATNLREKQCVDKANQQIAELDRRNAGRSDLSFEEQKELRDEQNRIIDARMECLRKAR